MGYNPTAKNVLTVVPSALNMTQIATPSILPASGFNSLYFKSDGSLYKMNSAGAESKINVLDASNNLSMAGSTMLLNSAGAANITSSINTGASDGILVLSGENGHAGTGAYIFVYGSTAAGAPKEVRILSNNVLTADFFNGTVGINEFANASFALSVTGATRLTGDLRVSGNTSYTTSGKGILGTTTNDAAAAGVVGEYIESVAVAANTPATGVWGDVTNIVLTAGDWNVTGNISWLLAGATQTKVDMGISTTIGNSATGLVYGNNWVEDAAPTSTHDADTVIANHRISVSVTTVVYLKMFTSFSAGQPTVVGTIKARRVR